MFYIKNIRDKKIILCSRNLSEKLYGWMNSPYWKINRLWKEENIVYLITSTSSNNFYIGETKNQVENRMKQHLQNAMKQGMKKEKEGSMNLVKQMKRSKIEDWIIIPLYGGTNSRKRIERTLIKQWNPNLNIKLKVKKVKKKRKRGLKKFTDKWKEEKTTMVNKIIRGRNITIFYTIKDNHEVANEDLCKLLQLKEKSQVISWEKGEIDTSNYWKIRKYLEFANIYQEKKGKWKQLPLKKLKKVIKERNGRIKLERKGDVMKTIRTILKQKEKTLLSLKEPALRTLWLMRKVIKNENLRKKYKQMMKRTLEKKWNVRIVKNIFIKIPYADNINKKIIINEAKKLLQAYQCPKLIKEILGRRLKVVMTRRRNIQDLICNHIYHAKNISSYLPNCKCSVNDNDTRVTHDKWKIEKKENLKSWLKNLKNIPKPDFIDRKRELVKAISEVNEKFAKLLKRSKVQQTLPSNDIFKENKRKTLKIEKVKDLKEEWKGWTIVPRDKNSNTFAVGCPIWYRQCLIKTFCWYGKNRHYKRRLQLKEEKIMKEWKEEAKEKGWLKIQKWNEKPSLPIAYGLPKEKDDDLLIFRPIISYAKHPLKKILNITAKALTLMVKETISDHYTLWETKKLLEEVERMNSQIEEGERLLLLKADIKNMYTHLPHDRLIDIVKWIIRKFTKKNRQKTISVGKEKKGKARKGGSSSKDRTNITIEQIEEIVLFDLKNAIFKLGSFKLQQIIGIPMGSPLSPILAISYCAYMERKMNLIPKDVKILGTRYIDDIFLILRQKISEKEEKLYETLKKVINGYGKEVEVKIEETGDKITFLEAEIIGKMEN